MRKLISILVALALTLVLIPSTVAFAATSGSTTGSFSVGGAAPNISALEVYSDAGLTTIAGALTPQVLYYVKVTASDPNTLNDIKQVKLKMFYDAAGTHPDESTITTGHEQTAGIFTWTKIGNTWTVNAGGGTSWAVVSGSSVTPTMTASSGSWVFAIKLGKVATETTGSADFDMYARVTDNSDLTSGRALYDKLVMWYGEIIISPPNINFGEVALGSGFGADINKVTGVSLTSICNGDHGVNAKALPIWTGLSNTATLDPAGLCLNSGEFALKGYHFDNYGSAVLMDAVGGAGGVGPQTIEVGQTISTLTFWLKVAAVFPTDSYSGSITYTIYNA